MQIICAREMAVTQNGHCLLLTSSPADPSFAFERFDFPSPHFHPSLPPPRPLAHPLPPYLPPSICPSVRPSALCPLLSLLGGCWSLTVARLPLPLRLPIRLHSFSLAISLSFMSPAFTLCLSARPAPLLSLAPGGCSSLTPARPRCGSYPTLSRTAHRRAKREGYIYIYREREREKEREGEREGWREGER